MAAAPHSLVTLLALAWPIVVSRSSQVVIGFSDATMTGRLGEAELAATTAGSLNALLLLMLPFGLSFVVQSFASQLFGKGDLAGAARFGAYGLVVAAVAQLLCLPLLPAIEPLFAQLDYSGDVLAALVVYLQVRLLSVLPAVGLEALGNYYGGLGNTRLPMTVALLAMVLNVGLNALLIFGGFGVPALGVLGAALASVLSTWIAFLVLLLRFARDARGAGLSVGALRREELLRLVRFGLPNGLNWFLEMGAFVFFINVVVANLGTTVLAALMAVFQLGNVSFMPSFGVASAGAILVGQSIGRGERETVPALVGLTVKVNVAWQGFVGLCYLTFPAVLMGAFTSAEAGDGLFLVVGARMLAFSISWQIFDAVATSLAEALRAAGDTAWSLYARLILAWVFFVPFSMLVVRHFDGHELALVACLATYLGLLAVLLTFRFLGGRWKSIQLTGDAHPPVT